MTNNNKNKEKSTTSKLNTKTVKIMLFAGLIVSMAMSVSTMDLTFAEKDKDIEKKGKLIIKDKSKKSPYHDEMKSLVEIMESSASDKEKNDAKKRIDEIKQETKQKKQMFKEKQEKIRGHIDTLGPMMLSLEKSGKIPIIAVGTDSENESLKIKLLKDGLTHDKILKYEKEIRKIVGDEIDITIIPASKAVYTSCSQTGDCEPIKGGVKISVEDGLECSMGFKASYNQKTGFVTAGHCNSSDIGGTGEDVGNPSDSTSDKLGYVYANAFENNTWCDCMFVSASELVSDRIYSNINPSSTLYPVEDDWIVWKGHASSLGVAQIEDTYIHFTAEVNGQDYTTLGAVEILDRFDYGDSGGSVYENGGSNRFAGIISANEPDNTTSGYYIPYYRITNAFPGLTFTYT